MRSWIALGISSLALALSLVSLAASGFRPAQATIHALSVWSGDEKDGVTLRYLGVIPVAHCYIAGNSIEQMKQCAVGYHYHT